MPGFVVQVPQQTNGYHQSSVPDSFPILFLDCDCGLFMLQYIEEFLTNPFTDFRKPQVHNPTWFDPDVVVCV